MGQSSFADALLPPGFGRNEKLERISGLIDWPRLERLVGSARSGETGRPPYAAISMLKALLLQQMYDLSDPALEEALLDRVSFRRFCGFALDGATPDEHLAALIEAETPSQRLARRTRTQRLGFEREDAGGEVRAISDDSEQTCHRCSPR